VYDHKLFEIIFVDAVLHYLKRIFNGANILGHTGLAQICDLFLDTDPVFIAAL
jgi:hypothetical protein